MLLVGKTYAFTLQKHRFCKARRFVQRYKAVRMTLSSNTSNHQ